MRQEHIEFLKSHNLIYDYENLTQDDLVDIEISVSDIFQEYGFINGDEVTKEGLICEEILDAIHILLEKVS